MLQERGRISLAVPALVWRDDWLKAGLTELPLDGRVAIQAAELKPFHPDPADRFICATAQARGLALATADRAILDWTASLPRLNARH
jgi:PIN domain nuclease of toxin-antitoxin system